MNVLDVIFFDGPVWNGARVLRLHEMSKHIVTLPAKELNTDCNNG